ncbi:MAG TPA: hypothetical protein EYN54_13155 [Methylococcaceae bacterium]|nr:hypothetical protein [Methylococcaceae bacterium]
MSFNFECEICKEEVVEGEKFSIDSTEWETESTGGSGGIDAEAICIDCHCEIEIKINCMYNKLG